MTAKLKLYGLRAAANYLGMSTTTLARKAGIYDDGKYEDPRFYPDAVRCTTNGVESDLWTEGRLEELKRALAI